MWHLYRVEDDLVLNRREQTWRTSSQHATFSPPIDWQALAKTLSRNLTAPVADELFYQLGLPRLALDSFPLIGWDPASAAWTFPELDGEGRIIGIVRRFRDGSKRSMPGSHRGLTVPAHWSKRGTPLLIVEGQSDTLALSVCGVSSIGRPSNTGGAEMLVELLSSFPPDRSIIVLGENDQKSDGLWPGKDGAVRVASALAMRLQRRIAWALPPDGAKDIRAWILAQKPVLNILDSWHDIGDKLWV